MLLKRKVARLADLHDVQSEIIAAAEAQGMPGNALFGAKLSMEEVMIDAVKRFDPVDNLLVEADITASGVKVTVRKLG